MLTSEGLMPALQGLETIMRNILSASCVLVILIFPLISFSEDIKWSGVLYLKGTGATNCGKPRITNEAWDRCEEWARKSVKGNEKPIIKDVELYNIAVENDKGPSWNPKLNCNFRASVKCGYRTETISTAEKLRLSQVNKLKKTDAASCGEPAPEEKIVQRQSDCEVGANEKKPVAAGSKTVPKLVLAPPPLPKQSPAPPTVAIDLSTIKLGISPLRSIKQDTAVPPKTKLKWSGLIGIKGEGITNCSNSRINSEAWEICDAWAEKKQGQKGFAVKPEVRDLKLANVKVVTGKPTAKDPNPSCAFEAKVKCGYSTDAYLVERRASEKGKGGVSHDLNNLFGDGLRWSNLMSLEGNGVTNCGKSRIQNEAWEKCEAWAEQQKKKQAAALKPVIKNIELYNIASETEKGPSWDPKQSCSFHATFKCGYKME